MAMKQSFLVGVTIIPLLAGCAGKPYTLHPVGPAPIGATTLKSDGYLRVYTGTESHEVGENTYYYPHTGYYIDTVDGKLLKYVPNSTAIEDESPACVALPTGKYILTATSDLYATVTVPVVIQQDKTTDVHLDSGWRPPRTVSTNQLVYLPNGEAVGWRSSIVRTPE
jgi:hypothetical protein